MAKSKAEVKVRTMKVCDFNAVFSIDQQIRVRGQAITYASITAEDIFNINEDAHRLASPVSYVDFITRDMSGQLELGLVAEVEGEVRGFILGRTVHVGEVPTEMGEISILGVAPDYQRRGIATELVNTICKKFKDKGIETVRIQIDQRDKRLLSFFEHMGFKVRYLLEYCTKGDT